MALASHRTANKEFFESGCAPSKQTWLEWVSRGVVRGKIIDGKPFIDLNHFAASDNLQEPVKHSGATVVDLLGSKRA